MRPPLPFVDGPRNGEVYKLDRDQPMPSEIRLKGGKYVLVGDKLVWRGT